MKKICLLLIIISVFSCRDFNAIDENRFDTKNASYTSNDILKDFNFYPTSTTKVVYTRNAYSFSYSEEHFLLPFRS